MTGWQSTVAVTGGIVGWELGKATIRTARRRWQGRHWRRQIQWALQYIDNKYGSPEHAWNREPK